MIKEEIKKRILNEIDFLLNKLNSENIYDDIKWLTCSIKQLAEVYKNINSAEPILYLRK